VADAQDVARPIVPLTVVIPTRNGEHTVANAISSVCASLCDLEVIVIDDGSTDRTRAVVAELSDRRVSIVSQPNGGRSAARNAGLRMAGGEFVVFLDDDDVLSGGTIERVVEAIASNPNVLVVRFHAVYRSTDDGLDGLVVRSSQSIVDSPTLAGSFAIRRALLGELDGYDTRLDYSENTDLLFRIDDALAARRASDGVVVLDHIGLIYSHRPDVATRYRTSRIAATTILLDTHQERLRRDPQLHSSLLGILAHDLYRGGRTSDALAPAWRSFRLRPGRRQAGRVLRIASARMNPFRRQ
jgi:glycosyltransferase involved in cell wall biosynthesis